MRFASSAEPVVFALLIRRGGARQRELLSRLAVARAEALDQVVDRAELGVGALHRDLERTVIDGEQDVALLHALIFAHGNVRDRPRHLRGHDRNVGFDVRVVGLDEPAGHEIEVTADEEHGTGPSVSNVRRTTGGLGRGAVGWLRASRRWAPVRWSVGLAR